MSEKKQTPKPRKERVKSVPMDASTLEQIKTHLKDVNTLIDSLVNPTFVISIHKNTDMAMKKINQKVGIAKKTEVLKAIRDGKEVTITS